VLRTQEIVTMKTKNRRAMPDIVPLTEWQAAHDRLLRGRAEVERKLTEAFRFVFRDSQLTITAIPASFVGTWLSPMPAGPWSGPGRQRAFRSRGKGFKR
jgi:hypothetical protein